MCSQTEENIERHNVQAPRVHRGALREHLEQQLIGELETTLKGQDIALTVYQFWACWRVGLQFSWGRSEPFLRGVLIHLPMIHLERRSCGRANCLRKTLSTALAGVLWLVSFLTQGAGQHRPRLACGEQVCHANPVYFYSNEIPFRRREQSIFNLVKVWYFYFSRNLCVTYMCISESS